MKKQADVNYSMFVKTEMNDQFNAILSILGVIWVVFGFVIWYLDRLRQIYPQIYGALFLIPVFILTASIVIAIIRMYVTYVNKEKIIIYYIEKEITTDCRIEFIKACENIIDTNTHWLRVLYIFTLTCVIVSIVSFAVYAYYLN